MKLSDFTLYQAAQLTPSSRAEYSQLLGGWEGGRVPSLHSNQHNMGTRGTFLPPRQGFHSSHLAIPNGLPSMDFKVAFTMFVYFPKCEYAEHIGMLLSDAFNNKEFLHDTFITGGRKATCPTALFGVLEEQS